MKKNHRRSRLLSILPAVLTWLALSVSGCARSPLPPESIQAPDSAQNNTANAMQETADPAATQARFDDFTERTFRQLLEGDSLSTHFILQHPETYGLSCEEMKFPEISVEILKEQAAENEALKEELSSFDPALLTSDQLFTCKLLTDALETEELARGLELYYQPLSPLIGTQAQLPTLLAEYAFYDRSDVDDYLELLSQIDVYYAQLADYEKERAAAGLTPSDATLDRTLQSCKDYLIRPENSLLTETFAARLEDVPELTKEEKEAYQAQHLEILKEHFIPAYTSLSAALEELKGTGGPDGGLCTYENGREYYSYLVASATGTDSSVPELRQRIEKRLGRDIAEMGAMLEKHPELERQMTDSAITLSEPAEILTHLQQQIVRDFPPLSDTSFEIKHVPKALEASLSPAFFLVPPLDYEGSNVIYINDEASREQNLYTMLAHEGYPGHLYQSVYFNRNTRCPLHRLLACEGYSEGWGLYCELYSYSFDNGLSEPVQKLMEKNSASTYGLYALLDIHVNYDGWTKEQVSSFLSDLYGIKDPDVIQEIYLSLIDNPANYLKYYTGYLEITDMREMAIETLGNQYSPRSFHQFILDMDGAPFRIIKPYFQTWLLTYGSSGM